MKRTPSFSSLMNTTTGTNVQEEQAFRQTLNELSQFEQGFIPTMTTAAMVNPPPTASTTAFNGGMPTTHHTHHHHPYAQQQQQQQQQHHHRAPLHFAHHHPFTPTTSSLFAMQQQQQPMHAYHHHQSLSVPTNSVLDLYEQHQRQQQQQQQQQQALMNTIDQTTNNFNYLLASFNAAAAQAGIIPYPTATTTTATTSTSATPTTTNTTTQRQSSPNSSINGNRSNNKNGGTPSSSPTTTTTINNNNSNNNNINMNTFHHQHHRHLHPSSAATTASTATTPYRFNSPSDPFYPTETLSSSSSTANNHDSYVDYSNLQSVMGLQIPAPPPPPPSSSSSHSTTSPRLSSSSSSSSSTSRNHPHSSYHLTPSVAHLQHSIQQQQQQQQQHHLSSLLKNSHAFMDEDLLLDFTPPPTVSSSSSLNTRDTDHNNNNNNNSNSGNSGNSGNDIKSITSLQVWSEFISDATNNGAPIVQVNEDQIPATIVGGKSVTKRRRTPLITSMTVDVAKLKQWVQVLISMAQQRNVVMEHAESFSNVCAIHHLFIDLEELKSKVESRHTTQFCDDKWFAEVVLLVNDSEQDNGLESDVGGGGGGGGGSTQQISGGAMANGSSSTTMGANGTTSAATTSANSTSNGTIANGVATNSTNGSGSGSSINNGGSTVADGTTTAAAASSSSSSKGGGALKKKKKKKSDDDVRHAYTVRDSTTNSNHKLVEFVPLRAKVVSSNKKNCKLRYKVLYDTWFTFQVDSDNTFAINCGKTSKKDRRAKFGSMDDFDTPLSAGGAAGGGGGMGGSGGTGLGGGLSRVGSFGNLSYTSTTSEELRQDQELFNDDDQDIHTLPSSSSLSQPNFILSPSSGSISGNYLVFIQFKRSRVMIDGSPEHSVVLFGDKPAEIQQIDQNAIFVKVPPGDFEGRVPVKIHSGNITLSDQDLFFEYTPALPSDAKRKSYEGALVIDVERTSKKSKANAPVIDVEPMSTVSPNSARIVYRREWAIIIAISNYESKTLLASQKECVNDATNLMNILSKEFGFNVCTLFNEQATRTNILKLFESISENVHREDCVLVYFVGHSVFKRYNNNHIEGFIAPYDADPDNILNTGISHESFVNTYKCFPSKHIAYILDTCYMGRLFKIRTNQEDVHYFRNLPLYAHNKAAQVICASGDINDIPLLSEALFTRHLISALKTMRYKTRSHVISDNTQFSTLDQLGQFVQERVVKDSNGRQVPKYGRLEIGDGQLMFIPKIGTTKSHNTELERILSLVCVYEEYLQNMNLGDIHTKESLLQLMKLKFFQNSKFYLDAISNLLSKQTLELRSDFYSHMRLNVTEVYNTAKHSYLGVHSPLDEWMTHKPYQLADVNAALLRNNPNAVVKRIFILERSYRIRQQLINQLKYMEYNRQCGIDVRVVFKDDIERRKEIPRNFSIIDSRLCNVLYMENEYPKSVLIFNRKTVADMYYSVWVYLFNGSISFDDYLSKHQPGLMPSEIIPSQKPIMPILPQSSSLSSSDATSPTMYSSPLSSVASPSANDNDKSKDASAMMSLTDPLLSFESEENMKSIQHHLNPMLSGFKNVLSSLVSIPPLTELESLSEGARNTLLEKYQKICKCYESTLTTFFSEGRIETNSQFFDRHRVRLHDLESTVEKCYRGCIPVHSWLPYHDATQKPSSPYFTFETVDEVANMNKRLAARYSDLIIERVFVFHRPLFELSDKDTSSASSSSSSSSTASSSSSHQQQYLPNVNLHIEKIVQTLDAHEESNVKVFVVILDTLEEIQSLLPGTFCIIDNCLVGGTEMRTEQVPIRVSPPTSQQPSSPNSAEMATKTETNIYYVNKLSANPNDVRLKQDLWDDLHRKAMTYADFKQFISNHLEAIRASRAVPPSADLTFMEHL